MGNSASTNHLSDKALRKKLTGLAEEIASSSEHQATLQWGKYTRWAGGLPASKLYCKLVLVDQLGRSLNPQVLECTQRPESVGDLGQLSDEASKALMGLISQRHEGDDQYVVLPKPSGLTKEMVMLANGTRDSGSPLSILRGTESTLLRSIFEYSATSEYKFGPWASVFNVKDIIGVFWLVGELEARHSFQEVSSWTPGLWELHFRPRGSVANLVRLVHGLPACYRIAGKVYEFSGPKKRTASRRGRLFDQADNDVLAREGD
ncbi:expressed unknown protein [Seminavis robusta]|uniref:Uncharacterized protein n=1 Tax=Seminavis robusta TaxID=568900 RepID=A0A9N8E0L2_9STRA|nr:expressed unknown protein [Seminavis robusta]|eukprot:Sro500_g155340.1 n/a (262) ;mRNA; f:52818-53603